MLPNIEPGIINLWSGSTASIPPGWVLCDGNNGTPDLTDRFVVAAGTTYLRGVQSGGLSHYHEFTGDGHNHPMQAGLPAVIGAGNVYTSNWLPTAVTGETNPSSNLPIWYSVAYIMKT